jgi:serine/threonine-protein kinase
VRPPDAAAAAPVAPPVPAPAGADAQSIAVLPFVSLSADPENEYFSDGLTEELINVLTYVPGLRVVARTSAFCFKNTSADVREIGVRLNVRTVLEGSVRKNGNQLRVTAQLIDVASGYHLFSRTYPRELRDVFAVQEELAASVVAEIMPQVRTESPQPVLRSHASDLDAYSLYLKGMFALANSFTGPREGAAIFRQVLEQAPGYAPAWAGLASCCFAQAWFSMVPSSEAMPLARQAAEKALALDDTLGQGHAVLGMVQAAFEWDWAASEQSLRRAIELQPGLAMAHQFYAILCLQPQRRYRDAVAAMERAMALNPFDAILAGVATLVCTIAGDDEAALRHHKLATTVNPNHPLPYVTIGIAYEKAGRLGDAVASLRKACDLSGRAPVPLSGLAHALATAGEIAEAKQLAEELAGMSKPSGFSLAVAHAGLRETSEAVRGFSQAVKEREPQAVMGSVDPRLAGLRAVPEFRQLLGQMRLPQTASA